MTIDEDDHVRLTALANAAFAQVAEKVVEESRRTGLPIVVWRDGQMQEVLADQFPITSDTRKILND